MKSKRDKTGLSLLQEMITAYQLQEEHPQQSDWQTLELGI